MQDFYAGWCTVSNCYSVRKVEENQILNWPGNSPDLNPIQNLWTVLKDKVSEKQPTSTKELEEAIKAVCCCRSLVESMPKSLEAVIKVKGGPTKY